MRRRCTAIGHGRCSMAPLLDCDSQPFVLAAPKPEPHQQTGPCQGPTCVVLKGLSLRSIPTHVRCAECAFLVVTCCRRCCCPNCCPCVLRVLLCALVAFCRVLQ